MKNRKMKLKDKLFDSVRDTTQGLVQCSVGGSVGESMEHLDRIYAWVSVGMRVNSIMEYTIRDRVENKIKK